MVDETKNEEAVEGQETPTPVVEQADPLAEPIESRSFVLTDSVEGTQLGVDKTFRQRVDVERFKDHLRLKLQDHGNASVVGGAVITLELRNGQFLLSAYSSINRREPTRVISMGGARESAREENSCG